MRYFDENSRDNWIDENNVLLGFYNQQSCCESFGFYLSDTKVDDAEKATGEDLTTFDWTPWRFDPSFFESMASGSQYDEGGVAVFHIVNGERERFLHLYNSHNGYYSHGFTLSVGGTVLQEGSV